MTLDVIGQAGFNYQFNVLNPEGKSNDLNEAFNTMSRAVQSLSPLAVLQVFIPVFRMIVSSSI